MKETLLIAFEGSDGTGKETQSRMLKDWFLLNEKTVASISFPMYKNTSGGWALFEALKGPNRGVYNFAHVDPFAASLLYAADRREALPILREKINSHDVVVFDRYVESNLIHQGGKLPSDEEKSAFGDFSSILEYKLLKLPHPHVTIYLDLPVEVAITRAEERARRVGDVPDAVEANYEYIVNSHKAGMFYAQKFNWIVIPCVRADGYEYTREEINQMVIERVRQFFDLSF
jgi:dTMP kinase